MIKKSIQTQLIFFSIFIASFLALGLIPNYNTRVIIFDALFNSAKIYFLIISFILFIPPIIIGLYEFFSKEEGYEESTYYLISKYVIHICGAILYAILGSGIFVWIYLKFALLDKFVLALYFSLLLTLLILFVIWLFFKKKFNINILDIHYKQK